MKYLFTKFANNANLGRKVTHRCQNQDWKDLRRLEQHNQISKIKQ